MQMGYSVMKRFFLPFILLMVGCSGRPCCIQTPPPTPTESGVTVEQGCKFSILVVCPTPTSTGSASPIKD